MKIDDVLTTRELAHELRVDEKTVRRWVAEGRITPVGPPGTHHRFSRMEMDAANAAKRRKAPRNVRP